MARKSDGGPQLVGPARALAGEVEDDDLAARMIAATEDEIWRDVTALPDDDNSGDNSLEAMDEGFDGEQETKEPAEPDEDDEEQEDAEGDQEDSGEDDEPEHEEVDERPAARQPTQARQQVPQRQQQADPNAERIARLEGELAALRATQARPQPQQQQADKPAKPDMWSDPEGYEKWVLDQAEARSFQRFNNQRVDLAFSAAAQGPDAERFKAAFQEIQSLVGTARHDEGFRAVQQAYASHDPAGVLMKWWEDSGGMKKFMESRFSGINDDELYAEAQRRWGDAPRRGERGDDQQPARNAGQRSRATRSLNSQTGSGTHRAIDPEMYNGSESSVFDYATRN